MPPVKSWAATAAAIVCWRFAPTYASYDEVEQALSSVSERFGGLDILINNAGVGVFRSVAETHSR